MKPLQNLDLAKTPNAIKELHEGDLVLVNGVEMTFHFDSVLPDAENDPRSYVYLTKVGADMEGYEADCNRIRAEHKAEYPDPETAPFDIEMALGLGCNYAEFIQHLRASENSAGMMTRADMITLLESGEFVIA